MTILESELREGDRCEQSEFHRRYSAMPHVKTANLIDGVVFLERQVPFEHGHMHSIWHGILGRFAMETPSLKAVGNCTLILDDRNEFQPDMMLFRDRNAGGRVSTADRYLRGVPEFVCEITYSKKDTECHAKRIVYERCGVDEYCVIRLDDREIDWWIHDGVTFQSATLEEGRIFNSQVHPGLRINEQAIWEDDLPTLFRCMEEGLATPEHAAFVASLASRKS
jgi:hypothetical protein